MWWANFFILILWESTLAVNCQNYLLLCGHFCAASPRSKFGGGFAVLFLAYFHFFADIKKVSICGSKILEPDQQHLRLSIHTCMYVYVLIHAEKSCKLCGMHKIVTILEVCVGCARRCGLGADLLTQVFS